MLESRRRDVIRKALARALFDIDPVLYRGFAHTVHDKCPSPCNAPHMLATALVEELDDSGWELTASKYWAQGEITPTKARMALYDMLFFAFDFGERKEYAKMGDADPAVADKARSFAVDRILETLSIDHAVLSRRPKR